MARTTPPGGPAGPHELPLSEQQHRMVIEGRRLGNSSERCTVVLMWDQNAERWVFYVHASPATAAWFDDEQVQAVARHVLGRQDKKAS